MLEDWNKLRELDNAIKLLYYYMCNWLNSALQQIKENEDVQVSQ